MRRRGFTLTECLLVTTTTGACFALLVPLISSAWQMARLTKCSWNLHTIYQAEILWRAERGTSDFAQGSSWQNELMPYVEDCASVFDCPEAPGAPGPCDYGLSKGTYEAVGGPVSITDPKWILVLDYPKAIADYNQSGYDDSWDKYFILDEREWMDAYGAELREGESWRDYQALRHFGMANVLFCDGHIELLRPEDLWETTPLWGSLSSFLLDTSVQPDAATPPDAAIPQDVFLLTITANSSQPLPQDGARPRGQRPSGPNDATSGQGALAPGDVKIDDFGKPRWVANDSSPALAVTFYWNCTGEADVYLNGKPLRYYEVDFRTRQAPPSRVFSARRKVRNGDVITVGARRGELGGFLLVVVNGDGKVVWKTDVTHWKAYFPPDEKVWWVPEVAMNSERRPVRIQSDRWPPQTRIRRHFGNAAEPIWYERDQFVFLVSVIQNEALMPREHPGRPADR